jgi:mannopine transport system substrate-binding protein
MSKRKDISRRTALMGGAAAALALGVSPGALAQANQEVVLVASGGAIANAFKENFFDAFTQATGIKVRFVPAADAEMLAKVKAQQEAGKVEWDIVAANLDQIAAFQQFFAPLDCGLLPHAATDGIPNACDGYSVLKQLDGHALTFSTKAFPAGGKQPQSWADFWDVKTFPGGRSLPDHGTPWIPIAAALMADGVPAKDIKAPLDIERAFKKLDQIKPHVKVWWKTGDQSQQIVRDDEVAMIMMYSGRALRSKSQGVKIDMTWNEGIMAPGRWTVVKNAPNPKAAMAFLDFFLTRPEAHAAFTKAIFYDTANKNSVNFLPAGERPNSALYGDNLSKTVNLQYELANWLGPNHDKLLEAWNKWIAK